jgi:hypothetical protein
VNDLIKLVHVNHVRRHIPKRDQVNTNQPRPQIQVRPIHEDVDDDDDDDDDDDNDNGLPHTPMRVVMVTRDPIMVRHATPAPISTDDPPSPPRPLDATMVSPPGPMTPITRKAKRVYTSPDEMPESKSARTFDEELEESIFEIPLPSSDSETSFE